MIMELTIVLETDPVEVYAEADAEPEFKKAMDFVMIFCALFRFRIKEDSTFRVKDVSVIANRLNCFGIVKTFTLVKRLPLTDIAVISGAVSAFAAYNRFVISSELICLVEEGA